MAAEYGKYPNVMFETWNEPKEVDWGSVVKPYHEEILSVIRRHTTNIVICGTPLWSQRVDEASWNPVSGENVAYTLHFYAAFEPHQERLRAIAATALRNGVALVVTEWGTCMNTGNGTLDFAEAQRWIEFLGNHDIWDTNWAVSNKDESCSALKPWVSSSGGWTLDDLTPSGYFVRKSLTDPSWSFTGSTPLIPPPADKRNALNPIAAISITLGLTAVFCMAGARKVAKGSVLTPIISPALATGYTDANAESGAVRPLF
jgi:endoglucanase